MTRHYCAYGLDRHSQVEENGKLVDIDDTPTHQAMHPDRPSVVNAVCDFHAAWLSKRGWSVTHLKAAA